MRTGGQVALRARPPLDRRSELHFDGPRVPVLGAQSKKVRAGQAIDAQAVAPLREVKMSSTDWHITVMSADGQRIIFHACCDDEKEVQALATEARSDSSGCQIWIRPPAGEVYSWD